MGVNVGQVLRQTALRHPERVALVTYDEDLVGRETHSYRRLDEGARRAAATLQAAGVAAGDRVGLLAGNGASFVEAWFGIVYAGATVVPIPTASVAAEVGFRLEHAGCKLLWVDAAREAVGREAAGALGIAVEAVGAWGDEALALPADTAPGAAAMILYTSGTTGQAKGALISHASLMTHTAVLVQHTLRFGHEDCVMGVLPLTHSYGCRMVMLVTFYAAARAVLAPRFEPRALLRLMDTERATWLPGVPTMFAAWGNLPAGPAPGHLRWCLSAGAPLPEDVAVRAAARLGAEVRQGYGMTEATFTSIDAPPAPRRPGSVGPPVWGIEVRIVDEGERPLPSGEAGQVLIRGHNVMTGYLNDPAATAAVLEGGWVRSGDVGVLAEDGALQVVDRTKDLILRGGFSVYPSELEAVLVAHPAVAEVAVVGRPDAYYGEEIVAVVVPRGEGGLDPRAFLAWARERIASTHAPRELATLEAMPLGPSGKVLKRALRGLLEEGALQTTRGRDKSDPSH